MVAREMGRWRGDERDRRLRLEVDRAPPHVVVAALNCAMGRRRLDKRAAGGGCRERESR
jgi:hypothetical protein